MDHLANKVRLGSNMYSGKHKNTSKKYLYWNLKAVQSSCLTARCTQKHRIQTNARVNLDTVNLLLHISIQTVDSAKLLSKYVSIQVKPKTNKQTNHGYKGNNMKNSCL